MAEPPPAYQPSPYVPYDASKDQPAANPGYPPPPQFAAVYPGQPPQQFVTVQPGMVPAVMVATISFGEDPQSMNCPHCHANITTGTRARSGLLAWLICGGLTLFGCWPCCIIPFCCTRCQDIEHYCPQCMRLLGTYRRI